MKGKKSRRRRNSSSDEDMPAQQKGRCSTDRKPKDGSVAWTEQEMEKLIAIVQERWDEDNSDDGVCWREVAALMGNRNAKQCREKYRNDLRPEISKAPWSWEEDYVLALAHSDLGRKWSDIASDLPRRAENTIKNHWYATLRAKAGSNRTKTFLWVYVCAAYYLPTDFPTAFSNALKRWDEMAANSELPPSSEFTVERDYFTHGKGAIQTASLQMAEMDAARLHPCAMPVRSASARALLPFGTATAIGVPGPAGPVRRRASRASQDSACIRPSGMMGVAMPVPFMGLDLPGLTGMPFLPIMSRLHSSEAGAPLPSLHPASYRSRSGARAASVGGAVQQHTLIPPNMALFNSGQLPTMAGLSSPTRSSMSGPGHVWPFLAGSAAPINMCHSANGLQYASGMGMDGSGWGVAGLGSAGMGVGAMGQASDLGDASCQVHQLGGVGTRLMGMPGTGMEQLEGLHPGFNHPLGGGLLGGMGELSIMAGMAAKPAVPPRTIPSGRTSSSGAKHLPLALTFQPGKLPTMASSCGSAPLPNMQARTGRTGPAFTPFALVNPDLAHLRPPGGGYFSHSQPPPQGSMHSHSHQAQLGLQPASSLGAVQDHYPRSMNHPPASFPQHLPSGPRWNASEGLMYRLGCTGRMGLTAVGDVPVEQPSDEAGAADLISPHDGTGLHKLWDCGVPDEGVDELLRELGVDEEWLHEPPCDAAESPCKGARPAGTRKLPTVRETAASCMAGEGASRACFESPPASPTTRSLLAPDCDLGTDIWDPPAPHSTARTGMRPAGLSSRFAATGAPPFPLSELLDDAGAEHSSLRFCGGLMSPTAIHDLSVHGAVVQVQVSRAPAKPVKHESSAMDMMATPSNCGPPPSLWGLTAPGREAVPLAAPNTLQHYWASHYPSIHHRTGNSSAQPGLENALFGQAGRLPLLLEQHAPHCDVGLKGGDLDVGWMGLDSL